MLVLYAFMLLLLSAPVTATCSAGSTGYETKPCFGSYYLSTGHVDRQAGSDSASDISMTSTSSQDSELNSADNTYQVILVYRLWLMHWGLSLDKPPECQGKTR